MGSFPNADGATGKLFKFTWRRQITNKVIRLVHLNMCKPFFFTINNKNIMSEIGIGYITTNSFTKDKKQIMLPTDESVCGLLFDTSDFFNPFDDYPLLQQFFDEGQTHVINNLTEANMYGLCDENFMAGIPYYHIRQFYAYIGSDAPLYICFTSDTAEWSAIESMQMASGGRIFQIGVWTTKKLWAANNGGGLTFTDLLSNLETGAEAVCGKVGESSLGSTPLSIIVSPNTSTSSSSYDLTDIPDATKLNMPKVSVCLMQNGSEEVLLMQNQCPDKTPVGSIGLLLACLHLAYAEECIGYVDKFNLNKDDDFLNAEVCFNDKHFNVKDIIYTVGNQLAQRGYIIPCTYKAKEAEVFFSGDPTASSGDYNHIANNRIIHKCRRVIHSALIPHINSHHILDVTQGGLSESSKTVLVTDILNKIDSIMVNPVGQSQIDGRTVEVTKSGKILETDAISVSVSIGLMNYNKVINEKDDYEV